MFWILIVLAIAMWVLQGILSVFQLKKFNRELKRLRKSGRVAIGKARGRFKAGCLLMLCIDENCKIIKGRKLQGITSFASFKDFNNLNGIVLTDITEDFCNNFDKQTKTAILSAVEEYRQYTKQQEEKMCLDTPK
ncbi:DNA-binding transcriptional activator GutM [Megamonas hypermegale]|uniref:DNA-binding transcriptional activator GutM n=1 Tax=Megamonas hypermegale TaxID=158847 RepID=A0A239TP94_9FIRM|nr:transcriptional regulator GutM [Megamonas hypermegale]SNU99382.1 DNA-binding transcriptional activator GutM [Megamonas hypermegale]